MCTEEMCHEMNPISKCGDEEEEEARQNRILCPSNAVLSIKRLHSCHSDGSWRENKRKPDQRSSFYMKWQNLIRNIWSVKTQPSRWCFHLITYLCTSDCFWEDGCMTGLLSKQQGPVNFFRGNLYIRGNILAGISSSHMSFRAGDG